MNRIAYFATLALSLAAAGSAFAESPTIDAQTAVASTLSRADVTAQVLQARAAGTLWVTEADLNKADSVTAVRSRAEVRAETLAAIANGDLRIESGELYGHGQPMKHGMVATRLLAQAGR